MGEHLVIVVGDTTSHGGMVVSGNDILEVEGKAAACVGDAVHCPHHGETKIIEGFSGFVIESYNIAYDGCKTSCGAVLIAGKQSIFFIDIG
ncbi:MAG: hypothetical protein ACD_79C01310G0007 [uncultured bacterium]|nr:MAG: hypothetical protein ACD_79C01310G0007 [uncultured bacterium]OGT24935.1 MAG: hypothetical protein A2W47_00080 [Gammaproteobacteria bacterium RIFCSPHIGHO2_12_38_15]OGT67863.1 MAG: hypothetical protein A3I12_06860 [Gammaproteobacteria bacterium RIFCSPLOWO2_02_FULL_38_11]